MWLLVLSKFELEQKTNNFSIDKLNENRGDGNETAAVTKKLN